MLLLEFYDKAPTDFQDINDDHSQVRWGELRKTRLTLSEINKIRRMNEVQAYERAQNLKKIRRQYSPPAAGPGL
jgi:hypothetical protein